MYTYVTNASLLIIILIVLLLVMRHRKGQRKMAGKARIASSFGEKPQNQVFEKELIEKDWVSLSSQLTDLDQIDDVTWLDLEMDQVFCHVNHCKSFAGEQVLYSTLHKTKRGENQDPENQDGTFQDEVSFFESEDNDRSQIWYILSSLGKQADSYFLPIFINHLEAFRIPNIDIFRVMQAIFFLAFIPSIVSLNYTFLAFPVFVGLINIVIYTFWKNRYESQLNMLGSVVKILNVAKQIANDPHLKYENTFHVLSGKIKIFQKIYLKLRKLQLRSSSTVSGDLITLLESFTFGITLWDLIQYEKVIRQLIGRQKDLLSLYRAIGEIDTAISVASFRKTLPIFTAPVFCPENKIVAEDVFHPFLEQPVYNSITLGQGCMITGSNASGKSTFIKALAINALLGQSIHTCAASKFVMPKCAVISSMAVRDQVSSGESYYIREINYLKRMISALNDEKPVFCIIDEILRGTNTEERIAASIAILQYLRKKNCIVLVATHDIELTEVPEMGYDNYHFKDQIKNGEIYFEYKLYPGPTTSRNAIRLLEHMGFPQEIIENARKHE